MVNQSVINQSVVTQSMVNQSVVNQTVINQSMVNQSVVNQSVVNQSVIIQSVVISQWSIGQWPVSDQSVSGQSVSGQSLSGQSIGQITLTIAPWPATHQKNPLPQSQILYNFKAYGLKRARKDCDCGRHEYIYAHHNLHLSLFPPSSPPPHIYTDLPHLSTENTLAIFPTALILFLMTAFLWAMLESSLEPGTTSYRPDMSSDIPFRVSTFTNISITVSSEKNEKSEQLKLAGFGPNLS